jgi:hypothetical protein
METTNLRTLPFVHESSGKNGLKELKGSLDILESRNLQTRRMP